MAVIVSRAFEERIAYRVACVNPKVTDEQMKAAWAFLDAIEPIGSPHKRIETDVGVRITDIQTAVLAYYKASKLSFTTKRRFKEHVRIRMVAMYLCHQLTNQSYPVIGRMFGGRDHTTVMSAVKRAEKLRHTDHALSKAIDDLTRQITGSKQ